MISSHLVCEVSAGSLATVVEAAPKQTNKERGSFDPLTRPLPGGEEHRAKSHPDCRTSKPQSRELELPALGRCSAAMSANMAPVFSSPKRG